MIIELLILIFTCHFIGDYYFQNEELSIKKSKNLKWQLVHYFMYSIAFLPVVFIYGKRSLILLVSLQFAHALVDLSFYFIKRKLLELFAFDFFNRNLLDDNKKSENRLREFYFILPTKYYIQLLL